MSFFISGQQKSEQRCPVGRRVSGLDANRITKQINIIENDGKEIASIEYNWLGRIKRVNFYECPKCDLCEDKPDIPDTVPRGWK